jgi:hypothetical protein
MFYLSTTLLAKSSTNIVLILSPLGNELIKHKPREERDDMHEIQNYGASQGIQASIWAIIHHQYAKTCKTRVNPYK